VLQFSKAVTDVIAHARNKRASLLDVSKIFGGEMKFGEL
jgi:hypothetical protein